MSISSVLIFFHSTSDNNSFFLEISAFKASSHSLVSISISSFILSLSNQNSLDMSFIISLLKTSLSS
ncbi:MAG: hypothetical protein P1U46_03700 [Patescibacteria group bacterium]|nr:hypothetical protein [Patescibacteria group bacterium]